MTLYLHRLTMATGIQLYSICMFLLLLFCPWILRPVNRIGLPQDEVVLSNPKPDVTNV